MDSSGIGDGSVHPTHLQHVLNKTKASSWGEMLAQLLSIRSAQLVHGTAFGRLQTPISRGFDLIAAHIVSTFTGFSKVYRLIEEKILVIEPADTRISAYTVLSILLHRSDINKLIVDGLVECMQNGTRSSKLAVVLFLEFVLLNETTNDKCISSKSTELENYRQRLFQALIPYLLKCVDSDGMLNESVGQFQKTRLTILASTVILVQLRFDALAVAQKSSITNSEKRVLIQDDSCIRNTAGHLVLYIQSMSKYLSDNRLHAPFFKKIALIVQDEMDQLPQTHESLAVLVATISKAIVPREYFSSNKIIKKLESILEKERDFMLKLIQTCAVLAAVSQEQMDTVVSSLLVQQQLLKLISVSIHQTQSKQLRSLAFDLLRQTLVALDSGMFTSIMDPLAAMFCIENNESVHQLYDISLLQDIAGVIAEFAVIHPQAALKDMFVLLSSESMAVRQNGLFILQQVLKLNKEQIKSNPHFKISQYIGKHFLRSLKNINLEFHEQVVYIFSMMDPLLVIPTLAEKLFSRDEHEQFTSESILVQLLLCSNPQLSALEIFIEYIRVMNAQKPYCRPPKYDSPAQIGRLPIQTPTSSNTHDTVTKIDRLFRVFSKCVEKIDEQADDLISTLVQKLYGCPSDPLLVRILSSFIPVLLQSSSSCIKVIRICINIMSTQPRLAENLLLSEIPNAVETVLFARLCPLLILKMIPLEALDRLPYLEPFDEPKDYWQMDSSYKSDDDGYTSCSALSDCMLISRLADCLLVRIEYPLEFEDVQKLACQVIAQLPLWYITHSLFVTKLDKVIFSSNLRCTRLIIFIGCHAVMARSSFGTMENEMLKSLGSRMFLTIAWKPDLSLAIGCEANEKETILSKIQSGSIELLSLIICNEAKSNSSHVLPTHIYKSGDPIEETKGANRASVKSMSASKVGLKTMDDNTTVQPIVSIADVTESIKQCLDPYSRLPQSIQILYRQLFQKDSANVDDMEFRCSLTTGLANAIHFAVKLLCLSGSKHGTSTTIDPSQAATISHEIEPRNANAFLWLYHQLAPLLVDVCMTILQQAKCSTTETEIHRPEIVIAAMLQSLFLFMFITTRSSYATPNPIQTRPLVSMLFEGLNYPHQLVRLECLKIISAALAGMDRLLLDLETVAQLRIRLKERAVMENDVKCRTLTQRLYDMVQQL
ncbi:hypothetical protein MT418_006322 [Batrachochytrium dendrobatidis]